MFERLPMFQRVGASAFKKSLDNIIELCKELKKPQNTFKSIHIAGTNGKGSTSHTIASILQASGYKTGLYTSPHLKNFTERIRVDGIEMGESAVIDFIGKMKPLIERIQPSFFEITVAMAFDYFAQQQVEWGVIEVGMGGRLDSTNIIAPELCVITNISFDHEQFLGHTLPLIAGEKAGIIKQNTPVVISERQAEVEEVFVKKAKEMNAPIYFAADIIEIEEKANDRLSVFYNDKLYVSGLSMALHGKHQRSNLKGILAAIEVLNAKNALICPPEAIKSGIEQVTEKTGLKGRWQKLSENPLVFCDVGHNKDGIKTVLEQISKQPFERLYMVWGSVSDKDVGSILALLPQNAYYFWCKPAIPRGLDANILADMSKGFGLNGEVVEDVKKAVLSAKNKMGSNDMLFIGGSTFVVAEIEDL
jgi:dihydrofolate synthase / folylpolyglutamate synthase